MPDFVVASPPSSPPSSPSPGFPPLPPIPAFSSDPASVVVVLPSPVALTGPVSACGTDTVCCTVRARAPTGGFTARRRLALIDPSLGYTATGGGVTSEAFTVAVTIPNVLGSMTIEADSTFVVHPLDEFRSFPLGNLNFTDSDAGAPST